MRPHRQHNKQILFLGGWLFTDLLVLLTTLFFISNVAIDNTKVDNEAARPTSTALTPTPPLPRLELSARRILLSIDPEGLLQNSPSARNAVKQQIRGWQHGLLATRRVGLAIVYAGALDAGQIQNALKVDNKIASVLRDLGKQEIAFKQTSYYDEPLYILGTDNNVARIDIYLFAK